MPPEAVGQPWYSRCIEEIERHPERLSRWDADQFRFLKDRIEKGVGLTEAQENDLRNLNRRATTPRKKHGYIKTKKQNRKPLSRI